MQSLIPGIFVCQHLSFGADKQNSAISITELLALFQLRWSGRCDTAIHPLDRYISLCFICLGKSERSMACRWWGVREISSLPPTGIDLAHTSVKGHEYSPPRVNSIPHLLSELSDSI